MRGIKQNGRLVKVYFETLSDEEKMMLRKFID